MADEWSQSFGAGAAKLNARALRHVVTLQKVSQVVDDYGAQSTVYSDLFPGVLTRAKISPLSGREYAAANQVSVEISTRIVVRWRPGIEETQRILHTPVEGVSPLMTDVYDVTAVLPDPTTGKEWLTILCSKRQTEGYRRGS